MRIKKLLALFILIICLLVTFYFSLTNGASNIEIATIWDALFKFDANTQTHQIIRNLRLPRILTAFVVGSSFAVSGALMQGATRNSLADSGLLGVNSGAAFGLALGFILFPNSLSSASMIFSFSGAAVVTLLIFLITRYTMRTLSPIKLVLAGVAVSSLFSALSQALALYFNLQQDLIFWYIGGVANVTWAQLITILPAFFLGLLGSFVLASQLNCLILGDETAISLGKNPLIIRGCAMILTVILAGMAVSLVGPVSFVGLLIPHIIRYFTDENYQLIIPFSVLLGGILVMLADLFARLINPPFETPFGILISVIGVPFLLYKVRRETN